MPCDALRRLNFLTIRQRDIEDRDRRQRACQLGPGTAIRAMRYAGLALDGEG
jgi:hypothetical protein